MYRNCVGHTECMKYVEKTCYQLILTTITVITMFILHILQFTHSTYSTSKHSTLHSRCKMPYLITCYSSHIYSHTGLTYAAIHLSCAIYQMCISYHTCYTSRMSYSSHLQFFIGTNYLTCNPSHICYSSHMIFIWRLWFILHVPFTAIHIMLFIADIIFITYSTDQSHIFIAYSIYRAGVISKSSHARIILLPSSLPC